MAEPSSLRWLVAKVSGNLILFRVFLILFRFFSISFRVFAISFRVFGLLEDWYFLSRVMMSEPKWRVPGRRSLEFGPPVGGALVVGWGPRQEKP